MSELTGKDEQTLFNELRGVIFLDFAFGSNLDRYTYRTADEFLSGNVRERLKKYENALKSVPDDYRHIQAFRDNVEALTAAQPKELGAGEIDARLGATWLGKEYIQQFMYELLNTSQSNQKIYTVHFTPQTGEWQITGKGREAQFSDIHANVTYGTKRMNGYEILDETLNLRDVRVYDYKEDSDGKEIRVLNKKETMLAQQKQEAIKQAFRDWLWKDPERRETLVQKYNVLFNSVRPREYDGSHLALSGISPGIELKPHQLNAVARQMYGGNTLLAHVVGAGKTFEMIAAAMESKRLGLCNKSLFAVSNHLTKWCIALRHIITSHNNGL
jgi:N12 class adenine-specific DNA methylase